jgi:hypothetical protein
MSLTVVNGVSSTSPDSGYSCGGKKSGLWNFYSKNSFFNSFQPQNTLQTPLKHQETNLLT